MRLIHRIKVDFPQGFKTIVLTKNENKDQINTKTNTQQNTEIINNENLNKMGFSKMYFNNCQGNIFTENISNNEDLENWYGNNAFANVYSRGLNSVTFIDVKKLYERIYNR